jgi:hypothetical protein
MSGTPSKRALPAQYRLARNIQEGYEVCDSEGVWLRVEHAMHILGPIAMSSFRLADGDRMTYPPSTRIMSRRPVPPEDTDD